MKLWEAQRIGALDLTGNGEPFRSLDLYYY